MPLIPIGKEITKNKISINRIVREFAKRSGISIAKSRVIFKIFNQVLIDMTLKAGYIELPNFLSLYIKEIPNRGGKSPLTGELYKPQSIKQLQHRTSRKFKNLMNARD